ncbi:Unknown protein [Striga hermonthica]|uniref:Integrase zinc-binding domain-containing protein n=1 Tax=Striga hermonthica TaxID=68872 RepID=A0A9N7MU01_STRHE|nr:Unknown protein [Striga hermonthica]
MEDEEEIAIQGDLSSLNAFSGPDTPRSLRLWGKAQGKKLHVLIDSGSTHNFIRPEVAQKLNLEVKNNIPFRVYVGNGEALVCRHKCVGLELDLQGTKFLTELYVLPIRGPEIVLGMPWLQELGKVIHDYKQMTMEFRWNGKRVTLQGIEGMEPRLISYNQLTAVMESGDMLEMFEVYSISSDGVEKENSIQVPKACKPLLQEFADVFQEPKGLPPRRTYDHRVHLQPGSQPVNVRPYRYPYFQKGEIERLVKEMLEQGIIRPSHSPYSSPLNVSTPMVELIHEIERENKELPTLIRLHEEWLKETLSVDWTVRDGKLIYKGRFYLGRESQLKNRILFEYHSTPLAGHAGVTRTLARVAANFYWDGLRRDVVLFVKNCSICQQVKSSNQPPAGLIQPLPIPEQVWEDVTMDFIVGLPPSDGKTVIMVVVDRLTKFVHFESLPTQFTASKVKEGKLILEPLAICGEKQVLVDGKPVVKVLVQWKGVHPEETTWEVAEEFFKAFPWLRLEDKAPVQEGGDDTNMVEQESLVPEREQIRDERPVRKKGRPRWHADFYIPKLTGSKTKA